MKKLLVLAILVVMLLTLVIPVVASADSPSCHCQPHRFYQPYYQLHQHHGGWSTMWIPVPGGGLHPVTVPPGGVVIQ